MYWAECPVTFKTRYMHIYLFLFREPRKLTQQAIVLYWYDNESITLFDDLAALDFILNPPIGMSDRQ